jgi:copper(I)-binding protein
MIRTLFAAVVAACLGGGLAAPALAHDYKLGDLEIHHPWARASIGAAKAGAAYMSVVNQGTSPDHLIGAASPVAEKVQIHTNLIEDGVAKMRPLEAVEVNPGEPTVLQPGGIHIMLMGLEAPLVEGQTFPLTLNFEKAGTIEVEVKIEAATEGGDDHGEDHGEHEGKHTEGGDS